MTENRWNRLKVGDVLEHHYSQVAYVVTNVERDKRGPADSGRVLSVTAVRVRQLHERRQWGVAKRKAVESME